MAIDYLPDSSETTKTNITEYRAGIRVFTIDAMPLEVPETLRALDPDTTVWGQYTWVRKTTRVKLPASAVIKIFEEIIKRQHDGFFTVDEAAQALEDLYQDIEAQSMLDQLLNAKLNGCSIIRGSDKLYLLENERSSATKNLVKASDVNEWFESQGVNYRIPSTETVQQGSKVKITSNHIQFAHGADFVAYSDLAELLTEAQCFGEVDDTNMNEFYRRKTHREALLEAVRDGGLPIQDKSSKTKINLGSVQLSKNRIESSTCVTVEDFQIYAKALGVRVSVAELNDVLQKIDIAPDSSKSTVSPIQPTKAWKLKTKIQRYSGYRLPLHNFLKQELAQGKPCPKARDVLEEWKGNPPIDIRLMTDGLKYDDAKGNIKVANLKAIQQAIKNLLDE